MAIKTLVRRNKWDVTIARQNENQLTQNETANRTTKLKHAGLGAWIASETLSGVACSAWLAGVELENKYEQRIIETN